MENVQKENVAWFIKKIIIDIFIISFTCYFIFYILEYMKTGFVSNYFDLNNLLYLSVASGVLSIITKVNKD